MIATTRLAAQVESRMWEMYTERFLSSLMALISIFLRPILSDYTVVVERCSNVSR